jgi:hypothetical protein
VFGSAQRLSVTDAALVNGTASHALAQSGQGRQELR